MQSRILVAVVFVSLVGPRAGASILSASSQAVREPSADAVAHWSAVALQRELNESLSQAADESAVGPLSGSSETRAGGGLMVTSGTSGPAFAPFSESIALDDLFAGGRESGGIISRDEWDPNPPTLGGHGGRGGRDRDRDRDRGRGRDRDRDRDRRNPYATPEPSTWALLGTGLALLGAYSVLRRRGGLEF